MKAIEILFEEVDRLNAQIKIEPDISQKFLYILELKDVIKIIERVSNHQYESNHYPNWNKDYL